MPRIYCCLRNKTFDKIIIILKSLKMKMILRFFFYMTRNEVFKTYPKYAMSHRNLTVREKIATSVKTQSRRRKVCRWLTVAHATGAIRHIDVPALARSAAVAGWRFVARSPPRVSAIAPTHRPCRPSGPSAVHNWRKKKDRGRSRFVESC